MDRMYIIVRSDLAPGLQIAQAGHALRSFAAAHPELDRSWYAGGNNLIVLGATDEGALAALRSQLEAAGCAVAAFCEPDLGDQLTAIAADEGAKRHLRQLPLALAAA
jgi:peptidyl-tRNA hydrolase